MNVLLVRLRLIGDVVFTTPAIRAVRRALPDCRLTYLVEPAAAPVVAGNPHLNEVLVIGKARGVRRLRDDLLWAWRLRRAKFDVVIDFHGGPRSAWLTASTGAPSRIGYDIGGRFGYTQRVFRARELRPRHSVENQWDLIRSLAPALDRNPDPVTDGVEMTVSPEAAVCIDTVLRRLSVPSHARLVVVHVSAGNPFRRWPEPAFVALVAGLAARDDSRRIILTAGPSDRVAAARITEQARTLAGASARDRVIELDDLDLAELHALTSRAALFVGGDSGPLHVASTTSVPIVAIFGPTLAERSSPWRDTRFPTEPVDAGALPCRPCEQRTCMPGDFRCLSFVTPTRVLDAAERALAEGTHRTLEQLR